jgi:hypothetical protein
MRQTPRVGLVWAWLGAAAFSACGSEANVTGSAGSAPVGSGEAERDLTPNPHASAPALDPTESDRSGEAPEQNNTPESKRCSPPAGVWRSPRTIGQAVELMNALPKPTSIACFVESLQRPLEVYLTSSTRSAQPAESEASPRVFIINDELFLSIVPAGESSPLLEFGYRTAPERAIRAELVFPLWRDVTVQTLVERVELGDNHTRCYACHAAERRTEDSFLGRYAFDSDVIQPSPLSRVDLDALRDESRACDPLREPERCEILSAIFDHGEVNPSTIWNEP